MVDGKPACFLGRPEITHPEIEAVQPEGQDGRNFMEPVYPSTEKLKVRGLTGRQIGKLTFNLFQRISERRIPENLPSDLLHSMGLPLRWEAFGHIHLPASQAACARALAWLKLEALLHPLFRGGLLRC